MSSLKIGIVAGEPSGDLLGASLIENLRVQFPHLQVIGIGGPAMKKAGCECLFPMEKLSVMGITEVLGKVREILNIRKQCLTYFSQHPPDVFIGIDAPDFNLNLEKKLKQQGIKTVHYTSPTVWAWKASRLKKIKQATDLMLTLFPFENVYYEKSNIPVQYVGHPLADMIPLETDPQAMRIALNLPLDKKIVALLPGSRENEIKRLGPIFLATAQYCLAKDPSLHFIVPMINENRLNQFNQQVQQFGCDLPLSIFLGQSHAALQACDAVLLASGTASLEAALFKKPMVVAFRCSALTYWIATLMVRVRSIVLPNLLSDKNWVPEFIQHEATSCNLGAALLKVMNDPVYGQQINQEFTKIHLMLRKNAGEQAATAIAQLLSHTR